MIIIKTPQPDIEERLVLVPVAGPGAPRDATPVDLERAGYVSREQAAPGTLAHLRADLRDMTARAEKAERELSEVRELQRSDERDGNVGFSLTCWVESILEQLNIARINRTELGKAAGRYARERDEAEEFARVLEVERDTARAELARLTAPAEGEPSFEHLRDCWDMAPRADASGSDVFRNGFFALYRLGVAHERARQQPAQDRATDEELERVYSAAYARAWESEVSTPDRGERAGLRAVAARVRQERCLVARAVAANVDVRVCEDNDGGFMVGVHATGCDEELARCVPASDVPATLARLLGEVSR